MVTGVSRWSPHMSDEFLRATSRDDRHLRILKELSFTSYMTVPLIVGDRVSGTVTLVSAGSGRRYSERDLQGVEELAEQIAGVVEHARLYDSERRISHTLQQSLLPDRLPSVKGLSLAARYLPADDDVEVGGDWYDVIRLGDASRRTGGRGRPGARHDRGIGDGSTPAGTLTAAERRCATRRGAEPIERLHGRLEHLPYRDGSGRPPRLVDRAAGGGLCRASCTDPDRPPGSEEPSALARPTTRCRRCRLSTIMSSLSGTTRSSCSPTVSSNGEAAIRTRD